MRNWIEKLRDWLADLFGANRPPPANESLARLDGATLFCSEYINQSQFRAYHDLYDGNTKTVVARIPFPHDKKLRGKFGDAMEFCRDAGIEPIVLFDCFYSCASMNDRIDWLRAHCPWAGKFELFNEAWQMQYPGEQFRDLRHIIGLINEYCSILRAMFSGCSVASMAPTNSLQPVEYDEHRTNNAEMLERLIKDTICDVVAVHLYVEGRSQANRFRRFYKRLSSWLDSAEESVGYRKKVWVTEAGWDGSAQHVDHYKSWISRYAEYCKADLIVWYRHTIDYPWSADAGYALEVRSTGVKSPLYDLLAAK